MKGYVSPEVHDEGNVSPEVHDDCDVSILGVHLRDPEYVPVY